MFFFGAPLAGCHPCHPALLSSPLWNVHSCVSRGHRPPAPFSLQRTMSEHSSPSQDSPPPTPEVTWGGALRCGPFPIFLMDIA